MTTAQWIHLGLLVVMGGAVVWFALDEISYWRE